MVRDVERFNKLVEHHERVLRGECFKTEMDILAYLNHVLENYQDTTEVRDAMKVALSAWDALTKPKA